MPRFRRTHDSSLDRVTLIDELTHAIDREEAGELRIGKSRALALVKEIRSEASQHNPSVSETGDTRARKGSDR
ncbi:hypothetical protein ACFY4C_20945 [Actinomadura viridis]|uniref:hypothetical protein n=1 Tax=Actinomadura viridis TaxID=58110 RepID=UPI0036AADDEF